MTDKRNWTRRDALKVGAMLAAAPLPAWPEESTMLKRPIPRSGEELPVIGLGTYRVFDVESTADELAARREIIEMMIEKGASLIDTSPKYDRAEKVVGDVVALTGARDKLFLVTKVWTDGKAAGEQQMQASADLLNTDIIDLMQVHDLRDLDIHMQTIRERQMQGKIRYNGITEYRASELDELEAAMHKHRPEFIQINYSLGETEADKRVLPLARDLGIAVIVNRPFLTGRLFRTVRWRRLPNWATPFAESWGQFFLKYIVSHPAVTVVIPATSKVHHMMDNLGAGFGEMPDDAIRRKMLDFFASL